MRLGEARSLKVFFRHAKVGDDRRDAIFVLRHLHRGLQDADIKLDVGAVDLMPVRFDQLAIG